MVRGGEMGWEMGGEMGGRWMRIDGGGLVFFDLLTAEAKEE